MKIKKIGIIGTNGLPGRYGGWDQLLNHLTEDLHEKYELVVYTSSYNAVKGLKEFNGAQLKIIPLKANGAQSILYDAVSMVHAAIKYDVLLVLGTSGCIFLPLIKLFGKKIILNPDGAEWKRKKWNKYIKWFLKKSEEFGVKYADVVVSDNKRIQEFILEEYGKDSVLIEYGGDNAKYVPISEVTEGKYGIKKDRYAFKVCRIEPENNIDLILDAFKGLEIPLVLIGNWEFSEYGSNLRKKNNQYKNLVLLDPIYEQQILDELRSNCGIYVHGHSVGGTNPSLVEAMNLALCCIVYDVNYNRETTENSAIYFSDVDGLREQVINFLKNEMDTDSIRNKMKEIAVRRYLWDMIVTKYESIF